jgi:hypothetical protein
VWPGSRAGTLTWRYGHVATVVCETEGLAMLRELFEHQLARFITAVHFLVAPAAAELVTLPWPAAVRRISVPPAADFDERVWSELKARLPHLAW